MNSNGAVWGEYDQRTLDYQYEPADWVPDCEACIKWWSTASAPIRDSLECRLDIPYGSHPLETLDVFPGGPGKRPTLVFIHGGGWHIPDVGKEDFHFLAPSYVENGLSFVSINYPLAPTASMDQIVMSVRAALVWLVERGSSINVDDTRMVVAGHSAGGHLTAMMLSTDWSSVASGLDRGFLLGGCAVSGTFDLEPYRRSSLNEAVGLDEDQARRNSPIRLVPQSAPLLILAVGSEETDEYKRQQSAYAAAWREAGLQARVVDMPGYHHFNVINELGNRKSLLFSSVAQLMK